MSKSKMSYFICENEQPNEYYQIDYNLINLTKENFLKTYGGKHDIINTKCYNVITYDEKIKKYEEKLFSANYKNAQKEINNSIKKL